jgi:hypothetical protein
VTLTLEGNINETQNSNKITFNPIIDKSGKYRIKIDHDNLNAPYYVPDGLYIINYSVSLPYLNGYQSPSTNNPDLRTNQGTNELLNNNGQYIEGKAYKANIVNPDKCKPIIIPYIPMQLTRTGGVVIVQFAIVVMILIGLVYVGERKWGSKLAK